MSKVVLEEYNISYIKKAIYNEELVKELKKMDGSAVLKKKVDGKTIKSEPQEQRCPAVTVDILLFHYNDEGELCILMGYWSKDVSVKGVKKRIEGATVIPGGHYERMGERKLTSDRGDLDAFHAAMGEFNEETGISKDDIIGLKPICVIDRADNDPRYQVIRMVFCGFTEKQPKSNEEIDDFYQVPVKNLKKFVINNGFYIIDNKEKIKKAYMKAELKELGEFSNAKKIEMVLGHAEMIDTVFNSISFKNYKENIKDKIEIDDKF